MKDKGEILSPSLNSSNSECRNSRLSRNACCKATFSSSEPAGLQSPCTCTNLSPKSRTTSMTVNIFTTNMKILKHRHIAAHRLPREVLYQIRRLRGDAHGKSHSAQCLKKRLYVHRWWRGAVKLALNNTIGCRWQNARTLRSNNHVIVLANACPIQTRHNVHETRRCR